MDGQILKGNSTSGQSSARYSWEDLGDTVWHFWKVYKMRAKTSPKSTVENMPYQKITGYPANAHGLREEIHMEEIFIEYREGKGASPMG